MANGAEKHTKNGISVGVASWLVYTPVTAVGGHGDLRLPGTPERVVSSVTEAGREAVSLWTGGSGAVAQQDSANFALDRIQLCHAFDSFSGRFLKWWPDGIGLPRR
jgi:hypothetical protein